jgi:DNA-binding response OmpR family regulator
MNYVTRGQKVMVADNDRAVLEMLQIRLDVAGYHTLAARTGQAAIDMMVLDLGLPDIDAFEILAAIGGDGRRPQFPVLVVGKTLSADTIRRAIQLGARDCMAKPFSGADLLERVERLLRKPAAAPTAPALKVRYVSH